MKNPIPLLLLLIASPTSLAAQSFDDPTVIGSWVTPSDFTHLPSAPERLTFRVPGGPHVEAALLSFRETRPGGCTWHGVVTDDPRSTLSLAMQSGVLAGKLRLGQRLFQISGRIGEDLRVTEHDEGQYDSCGNTADQIVSSAVTQAPELNAGSEESVTVDVMVVWTPAARLAAGGSLEMLVRTDIAMLDTNLALENSFVDMNVRLVFTGEVEFSESGYMSADLAKLKSTSDGHMDVVHSWRNAFGADAVVLIEHKGDYCGVGYLMQSVSKTFQTWAFSAVKLSCLTNSRTFAHELGHNFGSQHDVGNASSPPSHPYAYGYHADSFLFRTVMAYAPGITTPYFSSPDVTYAGSVMGIEDKADNARSIGENSSVIASWRESALEGPAGAVLAYGCGANPTSSLQAVEGAPWVGGSLDLLVDNPHGTQPTGSLSGVFLSVHSSPLYPCGTPAPGLGMEYPGATGEILIDENAPGVYVPGSAWVPNAPAVVSIDVPDDPVLVGLSVFAQGAIWDPTAYTGIEVGLTDGLELRLSH